jgi:hypothetical protein
VDGKGRTYYLAGDTLSLLGAYVVRRLFKLSAARLFDNAKRRGVGKRIPGDDAVAVADDDCARLGQAAIRVLLPSLAGNFVEVVGPDLDVVGFGVCHAA